MCRCASGTPVHSYSGSGGWLSRGPMYVHNTPPRSTSGYPASFTLLQNPDAAGSLGTSMHWPVTSYFQPWYAQRIPPFSFRPNHSETPRCAQNSPMSPYRPSLSRNAISSSESSVTRTGAESFCARSAARSAGIQYLRKSSPIGVPGPVRVRNSLSSLFMANACRVLPLRRRVSICRSRREP